MTYVLPDEGLRKAVEGWAGEFNGKRAVVFFNRKDEPLRELVGPQVRERFYYRSHYDRELKAVMVVDSDRQVYLALVNDEKTLYALAVSGEPPKAEWLPVTKTMRSLWKSIWNKRGKKWPSHLT